MLGKLGDLQVQRWKKIYLSYIAKRYISHKNVFKRGGVMKKLFVLAIVFLLMVVFTSGEKLKIMKEISKPVSLSIGHQELLVMEGASVFIYSLPDLNLARSFGKEGEGPGELKVVNTYSNHVNGYSDYILAESIDKLVYFTRQGQLIKELRKPGRTILTLPLGSNYVLKRLENRKDGKSYAVVSIYDSKMKKIRELYQQEWVQQGGTPGQIQFEMIGDFINLAVWDNKLFLEKSPAGFLIEVYDSKGENLYQIKREDASIPVTERDQKMAIDQFRKDPALKPQITALGGWNQVKKMFSMKFLPCFPPIRWMEIDQGRLYITSYRERSNRLQVQIMDLKGNRLAVAGRPKMPPVPLSLKILGVNLSVLKNDYLYFMVENEATEQWELHREKLGHY